jgi:hypothetical protein
MPKIRWDALPAVVKNHLLDRVRTREISSQDLTAMMKWINDDEMD